MADNAQNTGSSGSAPSLDAFLNDLETYLSEPIPAAAAAGMTMVGPDAEDVVTVTSPAAFEMGSVHIIEENDITSSIQPAEPEDFDITEIISDFSGGDGLVDLTGIEPISGLDNVLEVAGGNTNTIFDFGGGDVLVLVDSDLDMNSPDVFTI